MKNTVILNVLLIVSLFAVAQHEKRYKSEADSLRREIWNWNKPGLADYTIPAEYVNTSKVIIARHVSIMTGKKVPRPWYPMSKSFSELEITREVIKINDKSALDEYSELKFVRIQGLPSDNSQYGIKMTFVGIKVIKPDGRIIEPDMKDIMTKESEGVGKEVKLAVPELQVGDVLDYYVASRTDCSGADDKLLTDYLLDEHSFTFSLYDNCHVLHYSIQCETSKNFAVEYRCYNGDIDFKHSEEEGYDILKFEKNNIPPFSESGLWVSPYRQMPVIRMNILMGGKKKKWYAKVNARERGIIYANPPADEFIQDEKLIVRQSFEGSMGFSSNLSEKALKYYDQLSKDRNKLPFDSVIAELFYLYRYAAFLNVQPYSDISTVINIPKKTINPNDYIFNFRTLLKRNDFNCEMVFVTPRNAPFLREVLSPDDINWMLLVKGDKDRLFGVTDIFSPAFHIPGEYENTKQAITMPVTDKKKEAPDGNLDIPGSSALENARIETINLIPSSNGTELQVSRKTILKGHYKAGVQKKLILFEDFCNAERKLLGEDKTMIEELERMKNKKSYAPELKTAFDKERVKQRDEFVSEAKEWFDQPISELTDYKIENMGVRHNNPDFIYSSKFNMGGLIKKAGNNMIIDIGKMQGTPLIISPGQRKRKLDIYMPFARSLQAQITLQIPDGYTADGINELNKKVENEAGYFIAEATSDGKSVTINVRKSYNHAFEPVGNWEKLLAFIDAANEWSNAKILLKKK